MTVAPGSSVCLCLCRFDREGKRNRVKREGADYVAFYCVHLYLRPPVFACMALEYLCKSVCVRNSPRLRAFKHLFKGFSCLFRVTEKWQIDKKRLKQTLPVHYKGCAFERT